MREHVLKKKKKSLLKINEALWRQNVRDDGVRADTGHLNRHQEFDLKKNSVYMCKHGLHLCVCICGLRQHRFVTSVPKAQWD